MKTSILARMLLVGIVFKQCVFAGPLVEKNRSEKAAAVAGAVTAQMAMRPLNPAGPFVEHFLRAYQRDGNMQNPMSDGQLAVMKARLFWEYGPLSVKALQRVGNLNDAVFGVVYEKPALLLYPETMQEVFDKIRNLRAREGTFHGNQADVQEARLTGLQLSSNPRDPFVDLEDPWSKNVFQGKVYEAAEVGLQKANDDFAGYSKIKPNNAKNFYYLAPNDQITELVSSGRLMPVSDSLKLGSYKQEAPIFIDKETGLKVIAYQSEQDYKSFRQNFREAYSLEKRLSLRPSGFGNAAAGGFLAGAGISAIIQTSQGEKVNWTTVAESGGIGLASGAATVILAQQIEQRFGKQLAQSVIAKNLLPGLARGSLSGGLASFGVGAVVVEGFVLHDFLTDQITFNEAMIQSGIGLSSVGVGVGAGVIATWATAGTLAGSEVPVIGNAAGFLVGLAAGTVAYVGGEWYYENFKLEGIRAEMVAFKKATAKWDAVKVDTEIKSLHEAASTLRSQAAMTVH